MNIIKAATMENFRGYANKNNTIKFRPGINLVLGDNATGKSTIVTSILFNLLHKKIDITRFQDYRTVEPKDLHNFKSGVTLEGTDEREYTIEKILWGNNLNIKIKCNGKELKKAGELELKRQKDAQRFILDKFGVREEILEDILVQIQDPVKLLWPVREATEVGKELSKLLRLEPLQNIYTNARSAGKLLEEKAEGWEKEAENTQEQIGKLGLLPPEEYENQKSKLETEKEKLDRKVEQLKSKIAKLKNKKKVKEERLGKLKKKSGKREEKVERIREIEQELKGQKKPAKTLKNLKTDKENLKKNQGKLQKEWGSIRKNIGGLEALKKDAIEEKKKLQQKIKFFSTEYTQLTQRLKKFGIDVEIKNPRQAEELAELKQNEYRTVGENIGGLKNQIKSEKQYTNILSKAKAQCPVCDTSLSTAQRRRILAEKKKSIEELKESVKKEQGKSETTKKIIDLLNEVKSVLTDLAKFSEQFSDFSRKEQNAKKRLPGFLKKRKMLEKQLQKIEERITKVDKQIKLSEKFGDISRLKKESKILKQELKALPKLDKQVIALEEKMDKLQVKMSKADGDIRALEPKIEGVEQQLKNATEWYNNLKSSKKRAKVSYEMAKEVRLASEAAKLSLHEIFTNYSDIINANLAWIWPRLYTRQDLKIIQLNVEIKEIEDDGEKTLVPEVQLVRLGIDSEKIPFNTISSHGQRVLASIAFRIAFLNLLWRTSVPRILVFDEPTIWIDDKNRERLGQLLANLVKETKEGGININQVILISHDPVFLNAVDPEGVKHVCIKNQEGFCEVATAGD